MTNPDLPFNQLPLLSSSQKFETTSVLKACIEANKELAKLKMAERLIPNQTVLINSIPLLESQASSEIENIVTTTDELFEYAEGTHSSAMSPATKETLQYRQALYAGYKSLQNRPLNISTICEICSTIRQVQTDIRKLPGTALVSDFTMKKIYTPPEGEERIRQLLTNWQNYIHQNDGVDPLIKLAVQHYQFEAIHPFTDGNGRTGRIINLLYLIEQGLLDTPILYLSRYIIQHKAEYYEKLLNITLHEDWQEWIMFFLAAVTETARWTTNKIISIQKLIEETCDFIKKEAPNVYSKELVELLFNQPYVRISNLIENKIAKRDAASKYLKILCQIGFLTEIKRGRDKLFINYQFLNLLKHND